MAPSNLLICHMNPGCSDKSNHRCNRSRVVRGVLRAQAGMQCNLAYLQPIMSFQIRGKLNFPGIRENKVLHCAGSGILIRSHQSIRTGQ